MTGDDALNEYLIQHAYTQMMAAADAEEQRRWFARLTHHVQERSPERIREMERAQGLA